MRTVFMDHANATPVDARVFEAMTPFFLEKYGNASSHVITKGQEAVQALDEARRTVAGFLGCREEEITFTSGATESNNLAVKGYAFANEKRGKHIIASELEHFSITSPLNSLVLNRGYEVTWLPVDNDGLIHPDDLKKALRDDTILVSIQLANNEIGVIQNIRQLVEIVKAKSEKIAFHSDGTAACGHIDTCVEHLGVDMFTMAGYTMYGPKGVGALYVKNGTLLQSIMEGGFQEKGLRSGTENIPAIIGLAKACELSKAEMPVRREKLQQLSRRLRDGLAKSIDFIHFTGHPERRLPHNVSFWVEYAEGESLLLMLNYTGVMVSSGSACSSNLRGHDEEDLVASSVLKAIGVPQDLCTGSLTFSLGMQNTEDDVDYVLQVFPGIVQRLWQMSPFYLDKIKGHTPKMTKI